MLPRQARGHARLLPRARGIRRAGRARGEHEEGDGENHQESVMGGGANAPKVNVGGVGGALPMAFDSVEFMQVVRNTVQAMQVPVRAADTRATMTMKAFLQLRPLTFKGEPDPLICKGLARTSYKS